MADINRARLRGQLVENYEHLVRKLTRRLGSSDFAYEALHETFLRLERVDEVVPVRSPADYLFRIAINIAKDRRKAQNRRLGAAEIDALLEVCDDGPDPARVAEARSEIEVFYLPPYSPELNPDEGVNADLKQAVPRKAPVRNKQQLKRATISHMRSLAKRPRRIRAIFQHQQFRYAA